MPVFLSFTCKFLSYRIVHLDSRGWFIRVTVRYILRNLFCRLITYWLYVVIDAAEITSFHGHVFDRFDDYVLLVRIFHKTIRLYTKLVNTRVSCQMSSAGGNYTLSELLDLSLGTPEIGAVNFNILHRLLHAILSRLEICELRIHVDDSFDLQWPLLSGADDRITAGSLPKPTKTVKSTQPVSIYSLL